MVIIAIIGAIMTNRHCGTIALLLIITIVQWLIITMLQSYYG